MKLAEALSNRADLQRRISQLKGRLKDSAKVQEDDTPTKDVKTLLLELDSCLEKQEKLVYQINCTNMQIMHNGENLTKMLAKRDSLFARVSLMREVLKHVTETETRYGRNEIRYIRTINVTELRKETDTYCKQLRELDNLIQRINWTVDLL